MKFDHPIFQRLRAGCLTVVVLLMLGCLLRPLEAPTWQQVQSGQPEFNLAGSEGALGQGILVSTLGGFRAIMADFLWIQANTVWEKRERAKFDSMLRLVTTIDPRPLFFWIHSARMIAYDVPHWRIREEGGYRAVPDSRQAEIDREQAEQAFALIRRALEFHPDHPHLYLEIGQIYLNRLDDPEQAAPWFLRASEQANAPYYAARIYAELLRRQGKNPQALEYLQGLYHRLPDHDPRAQKMIILERIRELEELLGVKGESQFKPQLMPDTKFIH